jgi:hypothetical protein
MACIHGFAPSDCLICSTLQSGGNAGSSGPQAVKTARRSTGTPIGLTTPSPVPALSPRPGAQSPDPKRTHGRTLVEIVAVLALIVVGVIVIGLVGEIVRGLIHVLELALVAVVAAVVGYGAGRAHGRKPKT